MVIYAVPHEIYIELFHPLILGMTLYARIADLPLELREKIFAHWLPIWFNDLVREHIADVRGIRKLYNITCDGYRVHDLWSNVRLRSGISADVTLFAAREAKLYTVGIEIGSDRGLVRLRLFAPDRSTLRRPYECAMLAISRAITYSMSKRIPIPGILNNPSYPIDAKRYSGATTTTGTHWMLTFLGDDAFLEPAKFLAYTAIHALVESRDLSFDVWNASSNDFSFPSTTT